MEPNDKTARGSSSDAGKASVGCDAMTTHPTEAELAEWEADDALSTVFGTAELARLIAAVRALGAELAERDYLRDANDRAFHVATGLVGVADRIVAAKDKELSALREENARLRQAVAAMVSAGIVDVVGDLPSDEIVAALKGEP